jgi:hypothetical protein
MQSIDVHKYTKNTAAKHSKHTHTEQNTHSIAHATTITDG